jgi:transcriptional regulator GlxA family with amidase domain
MQQVILLLVPNCMASSLSLPLEMLSAANDIYRSQERNRSAIRIQLAAENRELIITSGGMKIQPDITLEEIEDTRLLVIPGLWRNPLQTVKKHHAICEYIKKVAASGTLICATGTGSAFLAESNAIHKKAATTHWFYFNIMKKNYPDVEWKRQHLITQSGNIYCAGSVNSIADVTIHMIEKLFNTAIARRVESQFSPEIRQGYQTKLFSESPYSSHQDELIALAQLEIQQQLGEKIHFGELANRSGIAYRSFQRRFHAATGYSPLQYQQNLRIQNARELLQNSNLSIQEIASFCGYQDLSHFSKIFHQHTEQTPREFRYSVRGKLFSTSPE